MHSRSTDLKTFLETSYIQFNREEYIAPDPLLLPREYSAVRDREIAALIASCLAVGRASLIVDAARNILARMGNSPRAFLDACSKEDLTAAFGGFRYRFFSGDDIASLLYGIKVFLGNSGTLGGAFSSFVKPGDDTVLDALGALVSGIVSASAQMPGISAGAVPFAKNLLPSPAGGSACKRPLLFLRWMIRSDAVDPGGWDERLAPLLVQPMDTHMCWVSGRFGFAPREGAPNLKSALEVTRCFRELNGADPVKYDFCLTRPGIHPSLSRDDWFRAFPCR